MRERAGLLLTRLVWLSLPAAVGSGLADALDGRSAGVGLVTAALAWAAWAVGLVGLLVPRAVSLTVVRSLAPVSVVVAVFVAVDGSASVGLVAAALLVSSLATLAALLPSTGERLVDGSSYGNEARVLLRAPLALLVLPVPLAWVVLVGPLIVGPLLLGAEQWVPGVIVTAAALPLGWLAFVRLHQLSRRWLVFVPAGVVVHDPMALADPVLFPRQVVARFGPAPADNSALDLTAGALGLALELTTVEPVVLAPVVRGQALEPAGVTAVLVAPSRPGHTLSVARDRRLPVG